MTMTWFILRLTKIFALGLFIIALARRDAGLDCFIMPSLLFFAVLQVICG